MGRFALGGVCLLGICVMTGCSTSYDCEDACVLLRDCGFLHGTSVETCEVRCLADDEAREADIEFCGECVDESECAASCMDQCVCALDLEPSEYPGVACGP